MATEEAPEDADHYSNNNSQAADKQDENDTNKPKIEGTQTEIKRIIDNAPLPKPKPPEPKPEEQPREKTEPTVESKPKPKPKLAESLNPVQAKPEQKPQPKVEPKPKPKPKPKPYRKKSLKASGASSRAGFVRFSGGNGARKGVMKPILCS